MYSLCHSRLEFKFQIGVRSRHARNLALGFPYVDHMLLLQLKTVGFFLFFCFVSNYISIFLCNSGPSAMV